jgi:ankyrin repeat protein
VAPEFFPFIAAAVLLLASAVASVLLIAVLLLRRRLPRFVTYLTLAPTVGLLLITGFCVKHVHTQFFLNEPMASAAGSGNLEEVRTLLDRGASPDSWGIDYVSPALVEAAAGGHTSVVQLLLDRGADPGLLDADGKSALQRAREGGHDDVVKLLEKRAQR